MAASSDEDLNDILEQIDAADVSTAVEQSIISQQMEADAAFAKQLADEAPSNSNSHNRRDIMESDDLEAVLEQIREMEAKEILEREGHAYSKPLSIDNIMANLDHDDELLRQQMQRRFEQQEQDEEYEQALDTFNKKHNTSLSSEDDSIPVKSQDDLRKARMKYFTNLKQT